MLVAAAAPQREDCASNQARATEQLAWRHACEEGGACTPGPSPTCPQRLCRSCAQAALDFLGARKMPELGRPEPSGGPSATKNAKHYNPMKEKTRQLLQVGWGRVPCLCAEPGHTLRGRASDLATFFLMAGILPALQRAPRAPPGRRRALAVGILASWVQMMAWLWGAELGPDDGLVVGTLASWSR